MNTTFEKVIMCFNKSASHDINIFDPRKFLTVYDIENDYRKATMSTQHINYTYWEEPGAGLKRDTLLPSSFCGDDAYKLYKITGENLK